MTAESSFDMETAFADVLRKNALVSTGDTVLVGLSGGADSVALLHLFRCLAPAWNLTVRAAHLDHGLRPDSHRNVRFAQELCRQWSIPLDVARREVPALAAGKGMGLEAVARRERQRFLLRTADTHACSVIALGHHRRDQAETVLHRLLRGTGVAGLAAMQPRRGPWIRPLLHFSREQIRRYLASRKIAYLEDQSNTDPAFTRNRIRHQLLPLMRTFNPRVEDSLWRLSRQVADEEEYWQRETDRLLDLAARDEDGGLTLDRERLREMHPALRRRFLRRAMSEVRGSLTRISFRNVLDLETFLLSDRAHGELHLPRLWIGRRYHDLLVRTDPPPPPESFAISLQGPGRYRLPGGEVLIISLLPIPGGEAQGVAEFDAAAVDFPLTVRTPLPGDRFRPSGGGGSKKLKDFFIDQKIDRWSRRKMPLVVGSELLWIIGIRRCEGFRPALHRPVLQLRFLPPGNREELRTN